MPMPGPLGRLVRRQRILLGLKQKELNERTRRYGYEFGQNNISRLETGISQRVNDVARLTALGKALEFQNHRDFIYAAYGPKDAVPAPENGTLDLELMVRVLRASLDLDDGETDRLRQWARHIAETPPGAEGPPPEERLASYARELVARRRIGETQPATTESKPPINQG